jgi:hypothetical protein
MELYEEVFAHIEKQKRSVPPYDPDSRLYAEWKKEKETYEKAASTAIHDPGPDSSDGIDEHTDRQEDTDNGC